MKISSKDFRVREGDEVNLKKWPTKFDPVLSQSLEPFSADVYLAVYFNHRPAIANLNKVPILLARPNCGRDAHC